MGRVKELLMENNDREQDLLIAELDHENRMVRARNERLERELSEIKAENAELYGLLGMAHTNLKQHLEHGFNSMTAQSTLISVGRLYPKLKEAMDKQEELTELTKGEKQ